MNQTTKEPLDRLTKLVVRAGGIGDDEIERISASPFLHARLKAEIDAERRRRAQQGTGWLSPLIVAWRAIAVLVVVTIAAVSTLYFSKPTPSLRAAPPSSEEDDIARVVTGGTCALSSSTECVISTEAVLATMFAEKKEEEQK